MDKKIFITLATGVLSFIFFLLSKVFIVFGWMTVMLSMVGIFLGMWELISAVFGSKSLNNKEKLAWGVGTILSLASFALGRYNGMLGYWVLSLTVGMVSVKVMEKIGNKISSMTVNPLNDKIKEMEDELKRRQQS